MEVWRERFSEERGMDLRGMPVTLDKGNQRRSLLLEVPSYQRDRYMP